VRLTLEIAARYARGDPIQTILSDRVLCPPTGAVLIPTRFWLQQGSAYHFAETAPDFSIKKLFNVVTLGAFGCESVRQTDLSGISIRCVSHHETFGTAFDAPCTVKSFGCTVFRQLRTIQAI
jgi:hypothetical protein